MRILFFIISAVVQLAAAAFGFFALLIVLNGYSERQTTPGLIAYLVLSLVSVPGLGALSVATSSGLVKRKLLGKFWASLCASIVIAFLGVLIVVVGVVVVVGIAEVLRGVR